MKIIGILALMLLGVLTGITEGAEKFSTAAYFPATPAQNWVYEGAGNEFAGFTRSVMYHQGERVQIAEYNSGSRVVSVYRITPETVMKVLLRPECYTHANLIGEADNRAEIVLKAPFRVGASWESDGLRREIISSTEQITVPGGRFEKVLKLKITSLSTPQQGEVSYEYYALGVGLILREYIAAENLKITAALKSVTLP